MTEREAKKIGSRQGLLSVGIGLLTAQILMMWFFSQHGIIQGFLWFTTFRYNLNVVIGAIIMLLSGHVFGQIAGKAILLQKRNYLLIGIVCGLAVLTTSAFLASWIAFFQEGIPLLGTNDDPFFDYIYKPVFWIVCGGILPVVFVGMWFGRQIKKYETRTK